MKLTWIGGHRITVTSDGQSVVISANKEGLMSLAANLLGLAVEETGSHIHLDEHNALEDHSLELIIEKTV